MSKFDDRIEIYFSHSHKYPSTLAPASESKINQRHEGAWKNTGCLSSNMMTKYKRFKARFLQAKLGCHGLFSMRDESYLLSAVVAFFAEPIS
jgi:hypothetical protein